MRLTNLAFLTFPALGWGQDNAYVDSEQRNFKANSVPHTKRVAIIGAGAAGSSAAYHLCQYADSASIPLDVTVFERSNYVGGRSTTVNAYEDPSMPIELGASIFVEVNHILVNAVNTFNLTTTAYSGDGDNGLGIWNGEEFVYTQGKSSLWNNVKLFLRYGLAPINAINLMKEVVGNFLKLYNTPYFPFEDLSQAALEMGLTQVTSVTGQHYLKSKGIGELFSNELVQASTRVNYAQNLPQLHGLETMVCLATDGAMSVEGGNWQIFAAMLQASKAQLHLETTVTNIQRDSAKSSYKLTASPSSSSATSSTTFDAVILAAPYQFANLTVDPPLDPIPDSIPYVTLHVTLLTSASPLSPGFFNLTSSDSVPSTVLTTLPSTPGAPGPDFFSISTLRRVRNPSTGGHEHVYKVFSPQRVSDAWLARLLGPAAEVSWVYRKTWRSYPYLPPRVTFEPFLRDDRDRGETTGRGGFWYTAGIESFISTMETSSLAAKNVARLIVDGWIQAGKGAKPQRTEL